MTPLRVLYVDDEDDIREVAVFALQLDPGLAVRACASGAEAVAQVAAWQPDLVLLDVMMPDLDGPATLARIRQQPGGERTAVVFITAHTQAAEVRHLLGLGAVGVIPKPFDPMQLAAQARSFADIGGVLATPQARARYAELCTQFVERLAAERSRLAAIGAGMPAGARGEVPDLAGLYRLAHGLAGAAGTFGFVAVGRAAAELETSVGRGNPVAAQDAGRIAAAIQHLMQALDQALLAYGRQASAG